MQAHDSSVQVQFLSFSTVSAIVLLRGIEIRLSCATRITDIGKTPELLQSDVCPFDVLAFRCFLFDNNHEDRFLLDNREFAGQICEIVRLVKGHMQFMINELMRFLSANTSLMKQGYEGRCMLVLQNVNHNLLAIVGHTVEKITIHAHNST